ncbi:hypothetical protein PHLGIDRAFT_102274 [Phlebiopsis gigantea 11061_1 CR5-6]|uniref:ATP-dependent RNA helicase n=1 Tax=Phlebiopsis gigantea (strain 11061_1 CR5-6) TaxID=745531 RepID=A0A0C3SDK6_PHLG1|nr:hypothetical protein PHLGIDRAFT_102274 [Phlebiopsis gigantea 11061_1 CR5-6]
MAATNAQATERTLGDDQPAFDTLAGKISHETLSAIKSILKLDTMSPVQSAVLPLLPELAEPYNPNSNNPRDLLVKAKTGTGKTLGFLIPVVEARLKALKAAGEKAVEDAGLDSDRHLVSRAIRAMGRSEAGALIISPTRELATQIANEAIRLTSRHDGFEVRLFVGGASKRTQMRDWMRGRRDIVVATPGRIRDCLENETDFAKAFANTPFLVLDEADTLLEMGFREEIEAIASHLPKTPQRQTFLFSATVSREIRQVARTTLDQKHLFIDCVPADSSPVHAHVPQFHTVLPSATDQVPHILRLLAHDQLLNPGNSKAIIFLPTTKMTQLFSTFLRELGDACLPAGRRTSIYEIHSKRTMEARTNTSSRFRKEAREAVLVTSDVSARGIDYPGVTRVIQIGIPSSPDQYVHRVGRTGRGREKSGRADLVLLPWEVSYVSWQLNNIPLKPLSTNELTAQVKELTDKHTPGYGQRLEQIDGTVKDFMAKLNPEAVKETLASQLGYYVGKSGDLRVEKDVIVEGLKTWSVEACGLAQAPYFSESFLQKLGISKAFGHSRGGNFARPSGQRGGFQNNREGRSFGGDSRPRSFNGEDRPPRTFSREDRPPRTFSREDRPPRTFSREDRPPRTFNHEERPRGNFNREDRPRGTFNREDRPRGGFNREGRPFSERRPFGNGEPRERDD